MQYRHGRTRRRYTRIVRLWDRRIGALVAVIALAVAPAARAGCAARCATPAQQASAQAPASPEPAPPVAATAGGHHHAHHHGPPADTAAASAPAPVLATNVGSARCGPADGRGCLVIRDTPAAPAGRVVQDTLSLAPHAATGVPEVPPAAVRPAHRTPPIRPPGPTVASLPLRI
jgi:hypothetical protein